MNPIQKILMMKIIPARLIPKLTKDPPKHLQKQVWKNEKSHQPRKQHLEKEITGRHIVTSQSRQQSIFDNKIETEQKN